jgi:glycogen/starch synthases, ADP-glucose type
MGSNYRGRPMKKARPRKPSAENEKLHYNILFASPEVSPFAGTGGLGEVAGSLPKALKSIKSSDIDCRVIMPLYQSIADEYRQDMEFLGCAEIPIAWKHEYMGVFSLEYKGVTYYFIDNEYYFKRDGLYGYFDDCERFTYFSRAVIESLLIIDFVPDIIHANDWQTAMIPVFQNTIYHREFLRTVFTIHNIEYQGHYGMDVLENVLGLPEDKTYVVEYHGDVNLMKGAIESSNMVSTVSPSYAGELKDPFYSFGLDHIIRRNEHKMRGILNGIDTRVYNPSNDPFIASNYSYTHPEGKISDKTELQKAAGLPVREDVPVLSVVSRLVPAKGMDLILETMDGILDNNDVQFILLGTGDGHYENWFRGLAERHPDKAAALIYFDTAMSHKVYAGSDIFIMPSRSEPCGLSQMIACRYGTVPVVRETGGLKDSIKDCTLGDGNGFLFADFTSDAFYHAVMNALNRYKDRENWAKLVRHDLHMNFSWASQAKEYQKMYEDILTY